MKDFCEGMGLLALAACVWAAVLAHDAPPKLRAQTAGATGAVALACGAGWRRLSRQAPRP